MFEDFWRRFEEGTVLEVRAELVVLCAVLSLAAIILLSLLIELLYEETVSCSALFDSALFDHKVNC